MRTPILLLALSAAVFTSCSSAYKSGQTPDDVYFSPERPVDEYVTTDNKDDRQYKGDDNDEYYDDYYLRMKVRDRYRWSTIDDEYYYKNPYRYSYSYGWSSWTSPWSIYSSWDYSHNPYCCCHYATGKPSIVYNRPSRIFNLNTYNGPASNSPRTGMYNGKRTNSNTPVRTYNSDRTHNSNAGNVLRDIFSSSGSSNKSSSGSSSSSSSSSNNSGSSKSGSSSTAPVRRF